MVSSFTYSPCMMLEIQEACHNATNRINMVYGSRVHSISQGKFVRNIVSLKDCQSWLLLEDTTLFSHIHWYGRLLRKTYNKSAIIQVPDWWLTWYAWFWALSSFMFIFRLFPDVLAWSLQQRKHVIMVTHGVWFKGIGNVNYNEILSWKVCSK